MEKLIKFTPISILLVYVLKCLVVGSQPVDAAILAIFAGLVGYSQFKNEEKNISLLKNEIDELKKSNTEVIKHQEELRSHVSSMKLGLNMKTGSLTGKSNI